MGTTSTMKAIFLFLVLVPMTNAVALSLCSSQNTASGSGAYDTYQSDGNCQDSCGGYAFAITQGNDCWCSDYAPGSTVDLSSCNSPCPGYPYEDCGSSGGLFGYVALGKTPVGTMGGQSSTQATTTKAASTTSQASVAEQTVEQTVTQTPVYVTVTPSTSTSPTSSTTPSPSTFVVTTTATQSLTSTTPSSSSTTSGTTTASSMSTSPPVTSIITLPGQTQVSTVVITPSSSPTSAASSPLGQGATRTGGGNGLSKGAVAGLAVGVVLGVTLLASAIIFLLWRRMKKRTAEAEATAVSPEMASNSPPGSVSRHTSQMSQSGLLGKAPTLNTRNLSNGASATSNISPGSGNRRSLGADQRLDAHHPIYLNPYHNHSGVSLEDNADYSRKILSVRNPDSED